MHKQADILRQTTDLCRMYGIKPARSKGQNFLINESAYDRIITAAELSLDDTVVEIGPGLGFLTAKLAVSAGRVIAVELDDKLAGCLTAGLAAKGVSNVEVVNEDVMGLDFRFLMNENRAKALNSPGLKPGRINKAKDRTKSYKVVANIPYNITSALIRKFLTAENKPSLMVLMVQKEVGERIVANPPRMSLLAVSVQYYGSPSIIEHVSAKDFWPQPEVDSCILKIELGAGKRFLSDINYEKKFFQLVKFGFSSKRKMLKNNLAAGFRISHEDAENHIIKSGLDKKIRAQELSVPDWKKLFESIR